MNWDKALIDKALIDKANWHETLKSKYNDDSNVQISIANIL